MPAIRSGASAPLGADNEEEGRDGKIGALRIQRDILKYSSVAAMVSGYDNAEFEPRAGFYGVRDQQTLTFSPGYRLRPIRLGIKKLMLEGSSPSADVNTNGLKRLRTMS